MKTLSGFTLIELLTVMGMLAFFAGLTAAVSVPALRNAEFGRVRETVRNELAAAQAFTISGTFDASWGVAFSSNTVTRYQGTSYATRNAAFDRVTTFGNSVILSGTTDVAFTRPAGIPVTDAAIVIESGALRATTIVNTAGTISVE